jgi:D-arabinose 1-dehydrogenase-like Zn-dependent alcohol dehydrogenase
MLVLVAWLIPARTVRLATRGWNSIAERPTLTYDSIDRHDKMRTFGGYSEKIIVREKFVLRIPDALDLKGASPLLCAGITIWSPLRHWRVREGTNVGVIGLGGLGHMALKLAKGLGANVTLNTVPLILGRRSVSGSAIGGIAETQELLDFCGEHGINADIEMIKIQDINEAYKRMLKSDVKYRFVIDMASLEP